MPEGFRVVDHVAIFLYIGGVYTALSVAGWELIALWALCGTGAALKLVMGRASEQLALGIYLFLGIAPLFLPFWHALPNTYPYIASAITLMIFAIVFGYMANYKGATAVWHACVLAASAVFWAAVFRLARGEAP